MRPLFHDRADAGSRLAAGLAGQSLGDAVVVGLARGGVVVAAEVARLLSLPLDVLAVRKIGHPRQPEYAVGAVTPGGGGVYLRADGDLTEDEERVGTQHAAAEADRLDRELHARRERIDIRGKTAVLVDDGLATGATMLAGVRWARAQGAARVVVAVPVAAEPSLGLLGREADEVVCDAPRDDLGAVGFWYEDFSQVENAEVLRLLDGPEPQRHPITETSAPALAGDHGAPGAVERSEDGRP